MPVDPRSTAQQMGRALLLPGSRAWNGMLSPGQRAAWVAWAPTAPIPLLNGTSEIISGYSNFVRASRVRTQFGLPLILDGPTAAGLPAFTLPIAMLDSSGSTLTVTVNPADAWASEDGGVMYVFASRPRQQTALWPLEIYSPVGMIAGSSTTPPVGGVWSLAIAIAGAANVSWVRVSVQRADGRLSG